MRTQPKDLTENISIRDTRSGVERFRDSSAVERIHLELRALFVEVTGSVSKNVPVGWHQWAYDVRCGRMSIAGGYSRFLDIVLYNLPQIGHDRARQFSERALALHQRLHDLRFPSPPVGPRGPMKDQHDLARQTDASTGECREAVRLVMGSYDAHGWLESANGRDWKRAA